MILQFQSKTKTFPLLLLVVVAIIGAVLVVLPPTTHAFSLPQITTPNTQQRQQIASPNKSLVLTTQRQVKHLFTICISPLIIMTAIANPAYAKSATQQTKMTPQQQIEQVQEAATTLGTLLDNWEKATVDCTYADVPRELLESKNKEQLLEKASTFALFDKSTSVVSCKKTNRVVRDYLGVTGKGPMVGVEKKLLKSSFVELVDPDLLDDYFPEVESLSQALSRATSLSYTAGVADFDSVNNFAKGEDNEKDSSNLEQTRAAIAEAKVSIDHILQLYSSTME